MRLSYARSSMMASYSMRMLAANLYRVQKSLSCNSSRAIYTLISQQFGLATGSQCGFIARTDKTTASQNHVSIGVQKRWHTTFKSRLPDVEIPDLTYFDNLSKDFHIYGDLPAMIHPISGVTYSFNEMRPLIRRLGSGLVRHGFKPGRSVCCLFMRNNIEYLPLVYSVTNIGCAVTTCNPAYTPHEAAFQLTDSGATHVFTTPDLLPTIQEAVRSAPKVKEILIVGEFPGLTNFEDLARDDGSAYPTNVNIDLRNDIAFLLYSSGTTGLPKGVMLTHRNLVANTVQLVPMLGYTPGKKNLIFLPMFHVFGLVPATASALVSGDTVVVMEKFDGKELLENIQHYKIANMPVVPPVVTFLGKMEMVKNYDLSSLEDIICGAAPMSSEQQSSLRSRAKHVRCRQGYGMTETGPVVSIELGEGEIAAGSSGQIIPNTEVRIVDMETGESLPLNKEGEITVRGPQIMKGYLNNAEATAHTIRDGWMHTGDVGYVDKSNRLFVVDRLKELIKYKGFQVAPAELEGVLAAHTAIADCGVVGIKDDECGEVPKAFVVLKKGMKLTDQEIMDYVAGKVAHFKRLKGGVEFVEVIPRAASGKILRRKLREMC